MPVLISVNEEIFYIKHEADETGLFALVICSFYLAIPMWVIGYLIYLALGSFI